MKIAAAFLLIVAVAIPAWAQTITNCKYSNQARTIVSCTVDGQPSSIPVLPGNRHWDRIVAQQIPITDPD